MANNTASEIVSRRLNVKVPFDTLPIELIGEIFRLASCGAPDGELRIAPPHYVMRSTIISVCRHWREVANAIPSLWNYILVAFYEYYGLPGERAFWPSVHALQLALGRSRPLRLDLEIRSGVRRLPAGGEALIVALKQALSRCRTIMLMAWNFVEDFWDYANLILSSEDGPIHFPDLESLSCATKLLVDVDLSDAPSLQHLRLQGRFTLQPLSLPTSSKLVKLAIQNVTFFQDLFETLRFLPSLQQLLMYEWAPQTSSPSTPDPSPIHLPNLRELSYGTSGSSSPWFSRIQLINAPNVRVLQLTGRCADIKSNQFPAVECLDLGSAEHIPIMIRSQLWAPFGTVKELVLPQGLERPTRPSFFYPLCEQAEGESPKRMLRLPSLRTIYWHLRWVSELESLDELLESRLEVLREEGLDATPLVVNVSGVAQFVEEWDEEYESFRKKYAECLVERHYRGPRWG